MAHDSNSILVNLTPDWLSNKSVFIVVNEEEI